MFTVSVLNLAMYKLIKTLPFFLGHLSLALCKPFVQFEYFSFGYYNSDQGLFEQQQGTAHHIQNNFELF